MRSFRKAAIAGIAVLALALSACAGQASKNKEKQDEANKKIGAYSMTAGKDLPKGLIADVKKNGKLTVGVKDDQPLIGQNDSGTYSGFDIEMARLISIRIFGDKKNPDKHIKYVPTPSENRETYLDSKKVDMVIASYSIYPSRLKQRDFAGPYFYTGQNAMVQASNKDIKTIADLSGKTVCIAQGSGSIDNLKKKNPKAKIKTLKDYGACAQDLKAGNSDAVSTDDAILQGYKYANKGKFRILDAKQIFTDEPYGIGLKKNEHAARDWLNKQVIEESYKNGDWEKAVKKTFGLAGMKMPTGAYFEPKIGEINVNGTNKNK